MIHRFRALTLAGLAMLAAWPLPSVQAQGLRPSSQPGISLSPGQARPSGPRQADFIVAVVNSEPITNNEVRARVARVAQQMTQQGANAMPSDAELTRQVLERLVLEKAQLQAARETGIKVEDAAVDLAEQNVARQNQIDVPELRRRLVQDGLTLVQFREELRSQLIVSRLREREVDGRVKVSDQDIDTYQREQQAGGQPSPQEINLAMLLVAVPENASADRVRELQAKAQGILDRAKAGEDFSALVRQYTDGPDQKGGGVLGMRNAERYPQLFVDGVRDLPVNGLSPLLRSAAGFHILKLLDKRQGGVPAAVPQTHARHILLRPTPQLSEAAARDKLLDFKKRIEAGTADFATLARENSQDGSAKEGGDLGWANPGQFVPEFEEVLDSLKPGQVSDPVVSRFGMHLIQLLETRERALSPREQREVVRNIVREKKLDEAYANWAQELRARAYVEYREPPQ